MIASPARPSKSPGTGGGWPLSEVDLLEPEEFVVPHEGVVLRGVVPDGQQPRPPGWQASGTSRGKNIVLIYAYVLQIF